MYYEAQALLKNIANSVHPTIDANDIFEPKIGEMWIRTTLLPGRSVPISLGPDHYSEYSGLYRIDIFFDKGQDQAKANKLVDEFISAYKAHAMVNPEDWNIYNANIALYPGEVWREAARIEAVWVSIPVFVSWRIHYKHEDAE